MASRQAVARGRAALRTAGGVAAALGLLGSTPQSGSTSLPATVCGTWVLHQPSTVADLHNAVAEIQSALALPGVVGLSLRFSWKAVDTDVAMLTEGLAIARAGGKALSIRPMAGRWTPARVFDAGSPFYRLSSGEKVPTPFYADGSPNLVFEQSYDEFVGRLAAWSRAN